MTSKWFRTTKAWSTVVAICCFVVLFSSFISAGDRDTHLTATHFLARDSGLSEEDAQIIASADWSMDRNDKTVALPTFLPKMVGGPATKWFERGNAEHSLAPNPEAALKQLSVLKSDVETAIHNGDQVNADRQLGQYLHALQDAFFHQTDAGQPYGPGIGHILYPSTDSVASNLESAVLAMQATETTLKAFQQGTDLPDPRSFNIYHPNHETNRLLDSGAVSAPVLRLAVAMAKAYPSETIKPDTVEPYQEKITQLEPDPQLLSDNLKTLWSSLHDGDTSFNPILKHTDEQLDGFPKNGGQTQRINFDTNPQWLAPHLFGPLTDNKNVEVTDDGMVRSKSASDPGGISLSAAAALAMPIDIDLDAIHYDSTTGSVILSGRASHSGQQFDAAIFLTALRLACEPSDPYFSLDPIDTQAYEEQSRKAFAELMEFAQSHFLPDVTQLSGKGLLAQIQGVQVYNPDFQAYSIQKEDRETFERLLQRYPALRPRLVFKPEWMRETRLGEILYHADVMLKEFQTGLAVLDPDRDPPVRAVPNYVSSDTRSTAAQLLHVLRGQSANNGNITGWRLWFDLAEQTGSVLPSQPPVSRPALVPASGINAEIADRLEENLRAQHLITTAASVGQPTSPELRENQQTLDLSQVLPKMFVRRHEGGQDLPGSDPYLDLLTADVNSRVMSYAAQYKELEDLIQVFRAYVAARKLMAQYPAGCSSLQTLPLLPSERVENALPDQHPTPLISVYVASIGLKDSRTERVIAGSLASLSGGIGLNYRLLKSLTETPSALIDQVQQTLLQRPASALIWNAKEDRSEQPDRRFIALRFDLAGGQLPVTMASLLPDLDEQLDRVVKKLDLFQAQHENETLNKTNQRLRRYIAILFSLVVLMAFSNGYLFLKRRVRAGLLPPQEGSSSIEQSSAYY